MSGKITHIYRKNKNVEVVETAYLKDAYDHHGTGITKIISLIPEEDWQHPLIPEYEIMLDMVNYIIPEYSISKEV